MRIKFGLKIPNCFGKMSEKIRGDSFGSHCRPCACARVVLQACDLYSTQKTCSKTADTRQEKDLMKIICTMSVETVAVCRHGCYLWNC